MFWCGGLPCVAVRTASGPAPVSGSRGRGSAQTMSISPVSEVDSPLAAVLGQHGSPPLGRRPAAPGDGTRRIRASRSKSPTWSAAASPSRSPANAHRATNARKSRWLRSSSARTCTAVGSAIAASALRTRGSLTPSVGSTEDHAVLDRSPERGPHVVESRSVPVLGARPPERPLPEVPPSACA